jgi:rare lipoprotein A
MRLKRAIPFLLLALAGCGGGHFKPVSDLPVKIGPPYRAAGRSYTPAADPTYDMLGYASWYGHESGDRTANGERFRANWVTGAHTTLPLPSYVEVTALDTGRRILVRVNDRGPFAGGARIVDLSRGAADHLGIRTQGRAAVRVRIVQPDERDKARLREGKPARDLPPVPQATLVKLRAQLNAAGY